MEVLRRKSRELAMILIYHWVFNRLDLEQLIDNSYLSKISDFDRDYFLFLLKNTTHEFDRLKKIISKHTDRDFEKISPVEQSILLISTYELQEIREVPIKVVINEAVELAKKYGGTDGFKYINGVLDKISSDIRSKEFNLL